MRAMVVALGLAAVATGFGAATQSKRAVLPTVEVYKSSTCGCCKKWVAHLEEKGFPVKATDVPDVNEIKARYKVPVDLASCHTALVAGYVVEGHVPAAEVLRLVTERPKIDGLAVPGMPEGSPGMEGPKAEPYDVIAFGGGRTSVFASYRP